MLALVVDFTIGSRVLTLLGIPYSDEGGSLLIKLHPGTYLAACATGARLLQGGNPSRTLWRLAGRERWLALYVGAMLFCVFQEALFTGAGGLVMLLDTFLPAGMIGVALCDMTAGQTRHLARTLRLMLLINATLALGEAAAGAHLINIDDAELAPGTEFRPMALYDHPLTGAAATMMGLFLAPDWRRAPLRAAAYTLWMFVALLAFGGRIALLLALLAAAALYARHVARSTMAGRLAPAHLAPPVAAMAATLPLAWLAFSDGLADRLLAHLYWDPSAQTRIEEFHILGLLRPEQILFGCRRADMFALLEPMRLAYGVDAIENFWLVMLIILGAIGFPVFVVGVMALFRWLWRRGDSEARAMAMCLLLAASSSNSLGHKSPLLVMLVGGVMGKGRMFFFEKRTKNGYIEPSGAQ